MKRSERGQSLVEGTLVMLVFFALLLGVVDFGQVLFAHQSLTERARAALRWGSLHPESGPEPVRNMVLHGSPQPAPAIGYLGLRAENIVVSFRPGEVETLHIEIVNFEAPLFAPWWPGLAHTLMNPRPVSLTAPVVARVALALP